VCVDCQESRLIKEYEASNPTGFAVLLVHGFDGTSASYQALVNDFKVTKQPVDVYTFSYSNDNLIQDISSEMESYMETNLGKYDKIVMVGHSLGGVIVQRALSDSKDKNLQYVDNVESVILLGTPNVGLPSLNDLSKLLDRSVNSDDFNKIFKSDSTIINDMKTINPIKKIDSINYYVIAGTKPYEFKIGPINIKSDEVLNLEGKNDGLITVKEARTIGGEEINNLCTDYWEVNATHSELEESYQSRTLIKRILSNDFGLDKISFANTNYLRVNLPSCNPGDVVYVSGVNRPQIEENGCIVELEEQFSPEFSFMKLLMYISYFILILIVILSIIAMYMNREQLMNKNTKVHNLKKKEVINLKKNKKVYPLKNKKSKSKDKKKSKNKKDKTKSFKIKTLFIFNKDRKEELKSKVNKDIKVEEIKKPEEIKKENKSKIKKFKDIKKSKSKKKKSSVFSLGIFKSKKKKKLKSKKDKLKRHKSRDSLFGKIFGPKKKKKVDELEEIKDRLNDLDKRIRKLK